jgi:hypothetical protein
MRNLARLLKKELERLAPRYASLSVEHAPLVAYPTLASLVGRLTDPKKNNSLAAQHERSELLSVVIGAYQQTHDRLWSAILVAAFRPMLATKRFYGADREEREAIFFAALTEVVGKLDVRERRDQVHAIVWRSAKKALVRKLQRQTTWSEVGLRTDVPLAEEAAADAPVTCDHDGLVDMPVTCDRHHDGGVHVTRDTLAHAPCDRCACAPCELSDLGSEGGTLAARVTAAEVLS